MAYVTTHRVTGSFCEIVLKTKPVSSVKTETFCGEIKGIIIYRYRRKCKYKQVNHCATELVVPLVVMKFNVCMFCKKRMTPKVDIKIVYGHIGYSIIFWIVYIFYFIRHVKIFLYRVFSFTNGIHKISTNKKHCNNKSFHGDGDFL